MFEPRALPSFYRTWDVRTSFLQHVPLSRSHHQLMLPFYPMAFESFDLSGYDLVLSLSSGFSHGVSAPGGRHVSYCLTPPRFLWTFDDYARLEGVGRATRLGLNAMIPLLRQWDLRAAQRVDTITAISRVVQKRIERCYGRASEVVYPAIIDIDSFPPSDEVDDYFLVVSRLIPYKRIDLAIDACNRLKLPLKIAGGGRARASLEKLAGPTVEFVGRVDDATLRKLYARCKALIFPGEEDLGLIPVEVQAAGRPVIAFGRGGTRETILDGETGLFFPEQTVDSLVDALQRFDFHDYDPGRIRAHARATFDVSVFRERFLNFLEGELCES